MDNPPSNYVFLVEGSSKYDFVMIVKAYHFRKEMSTGIDLEEGRAQGVLNGK